MGPSRRVLAQGLMTGVTRQGYFGLLRDPGSAQQL